MRYMLVVRYDGSKFFGFQRQKNDRNVQSEIEVALSNVLSEDIVVKGAGRTDRGVHARCQVVHFDTDKCVKNLKVKLNRKLQDIKVIKVNKVSNDFHARHSVKSKIYIYKLDLSNKRNELYYGKVKNKLDINKIKDASNVFLGCHNFKNFVSGERPDYNGTILNIKIYKFNNILYFKFYGIGFYRYMVRNLVGALVEVGKGKVTTEDLKNMLDNYDKEKRLPTISPNGLYLWKINY